MTRGAYGAAGTRGGGTIAAVDDGGPADRAGIAAGERVIAVDGRPVRDVLDWRWLTADGPFDALVEASDGATRVVRVEPGWDETPGVTFDGALFDGVRECDNACEFCFVSQLPAGMRPSLYVRDDDYRLSFLDGNFVTLTNLTGEDVDRIFEQRLSPLHWSVHAVDPAVRRRLVCHAGDDAALENADRLLAGGISLHAQIVLVPGLNDGDVLQRSLAWLAAREGVESVGVVPMGYTGHQRRHTASYGDAVAAQGVLDALEPWRERMAVARGVPWAYAADELYLAAGRGVPAAADYGGFPQYENGIGMVRVFVDAWEAAVAEERGGPPVDVTLVTGELFAPVLHALAPLAERAGVRARVLAVRNAYLGGNVSVAGLLTAHDVCEALRADGEGGPYLVPDVMFNVDGVTLDDVAEGELARLCGMDVRVVSSDSPDPVVAVRDAASRCEKTGG